MKTHLFATTVVILALLAMSDEGLDPEESVKIVGNESREGKDADSIQLSCGDTTMAITLESSDAKGGCPHEVAFRSRGGSAAAISGDCKTKYLSRSMFTLGNKLNRFAEMTKRCPRCDQVTGRLGDSLERFRESVHAFQFPKAVVHSQTPDMLEVVTGLYSVSDSGDVMGGISLRSPDKVLLGENQVTSRPGSKLSLKVTHWHCRKDAKQKGFITVDFANLKYGVVAMKALVKGRNFDWVQCGKEFHVAAVEAFGASLQTESIHLSGLATIPSNRFHLDAAIDASRTDLMDVIQFVMGDVTSNVTSNVTINVSAKPVNHRVAKASTRKKVDKQMHPKWNDFSKEYSTHVNEYLRAVPMGAWIDNTTRLHEFGVDARRESADADRRVKWHYQTLRKIRKGRSTRAAAAERLKRNLTRAFQVVAKVLVDKQDAEGATYQTARRATERMYESEIACAKKDQIQRIIHAQTTMVVAHASNFDANLRLAEYAASCEERQKKQRDNADVTGKTQEHVAYLEEVDAKYRTKITTMQSALNNLETGKWRRMFFRAVPRVLRMQKIAREARKTELHVSNLKVQIMQDAISKTQGAQDLRYKKLQEASHAYHMAEGKIAASKRVRLEHFREKNRLNAAIHVAEAQFSNITSREDNEAGRENAMMAGNLQLSYLRWKHVQHTFALKLLDITEATKLREAKIAGMKQVRLKQQILATEPPLQEMRKQLRITKQIAIETVMRNRVATTADEEINSHIQSSLLQNVHHASTNLMETVVAGKRLERALKRAALNLQDAQKLLGEQQKNRKEVSKMNAVLHEFEAIQDKSTERTAMGMQMQRFKLTRMQSILTAVKVNAERARTHEKDARGYVEQIKQMTIESATEQQKAAMHVRSLQQQLEAAAKATSRERNKEGQIASQQVQMQANSAAFADVSAVASEEARNTAIIAISALQERKRDLVQQANLAKLAASKKRQLQRREKMREISNKVKAQVANEIVEVGAVGNVTSDVKIKGAEYVHAATLLAIQSIRKNQDTLKHLEIKQSAAQARLEFEAVVEKAKHSELIPSVTRALLARKISAATSQSQSVLVEEQARKIATGMGRMKRGAEAMGKQLHRSKTIADRQFKMLSEVYQQKVAIRGKLKEDAQGLSEDDIPLQSALNRASVEEAELIEKLQAAAEERKGLDTQIRDVMDTITFIEGEEKRANQEMKAAGATSQSEIEQLSSLKHQEQHLENGVQGYVKQSEDDKVLEEEAKRRGKELVESLEGLLLATKGAYAATQKQLVIEADRWAIQGKLKAFHNSLEMNAEMLAERRKVASDENQEYNNVKHLIEGLRKKERARIKQESKELQKEAAGIASGKELNREDNQISTPTGNLRNFETNSLESFENNTITLSEVRAELHERVLEEFGALIDVHIAMQLLEEAKKNNTIQEKVTADSKSVVSEKFSEWQGAEEPKKAVAEEAYHRAAQHASTMADVQKNMDLKIKALEYKVMSEEGGEILQMPEESAKLFQSVDNKTEMLKSETEALTAAKQETIEGEERDEESWGRAQVGIVGHVLAAVLEKDLRRVHSDLTALEDETKNAENDYNAHMNNIFTETRALQNQTLEYCKLTAGAAPSITLQNMQHQAELAVQATTHKLEAFAGTGVNDVQSDVDVIADLNGDGVVTASEFAKAGLEPSVDAVRITFASIDKNGDGKITENEWVAKYGSEKGFAESDKPSQTGANKVNLDGIFMVPRLNLVAKFDIKLPAKDEQNPGPLAKEAAKMVEAMREGPEKDTANLNCRDLIAEATAAAIASAQLELMLTKEEGLTVDVMVDEGEKDKAKLELKADEETTQRLHDRARKLMEWKEIVRDAEILDASLTQQSEAVKMQDELIKRTAGVTVLNETTKLANMKQQKAGVNGEVDKYEEWLQIGADWIRTTIVLAGVEDKRKEVDSMPEGQLKTAETVKCETEAASTSVRLNKLDNLEEMVRKAWKEQKKTSRDSCCY